MCYAANIICFVADNTHCAAYIECGAAITMCAQVPRQSSWCFEAFQCSKTNHEYFLLFSNPSLTQCSPIQCEAPNKKTEEDDIRCYSRHPDSLASWLDPFPKNKIDQNKYSQGWNHQRWLNVSKVRNAVPQMTLQNSSLEIFFCRTGKSWFVLTLKQKMKTAKIDQKEILYFKYINF